jgi:hypothetical protein
MAPSSSGLGRRPFTAKTRVRVPLGSPLDRSDGSAHILAMLIHTETTPNPAALKFLPGRKVMEAGTRDFATPEDAEASPLAAAIFSTGEVEGVFFGRDFISVTAAPGVEWRDLKPEVLSILLDHFSSDAPLFRAASAAGIEVAGDEDYTRADRDKGAAGGRSGRRRHRLSRLSRRHRLSRPAWRLRGLPVLDDDAQAGDREPAQTLCARGRGGRGGVTFAGMMICK